MNYDDTILDLDVPATTVDIERHVGTPDAKPVTTLQFGGWITTIDAHGAVRVPYQGTDGKTIEDLAFCLRCGYALLRGAEDLPTAVSPLTSTPPAVSPAAAQRIADVLRSARALAQRHHGGSHDVYIGLSNAWQSDEMRVPYRLLIKAVRAALPYPTTLTDYCLASSREALIDLYSSAIELLDPAAAGVAVDARRGVA